MPLPILFRTTDLLKWGAGKGVNLTPEEVDENFWQLWTLLDNLTNMTDRAALDGSLATMARQVERQPTDARLTLANDGSIQAAAAHRPCPAANSGCTPTPATTATTVEAPRLTSSVAGRLSGRPLYSGSNHGDATAASPVAPQANSPMVRREPVRIALDRLVECLDRHLIKLGQATGEGRHWNLAVAMLDGIQGRLGSLGLAVRTDPRATGLSRFSLAMASGVWEL